MVFDPSTIKNRKLKLEELPDNASREQRIQALADVLLERGLATNLAAAKRLAEGMVDTERKIMGQSPSRAPDHSGERAAFQNAGSPLFRAVGGVAELKLSEGLSTFIERARRKTAQRASPHAEQPRPVKVAPIAPPPQPSQVMFADSPARAEIRSSSGPSPYRKTQVEASADGIVVRHVESREHTETVIEEGVVKIPEQAPQTEPKRDPTKEQGIDLFDIFNANK